MIKLPPLPKGDRFNDVSKFRHIGAGGGDDLFECWANALRARDLEVARVVLEAAAKVLSEHQIPVGNSRAGEMACEWTYDALKDCRDVIRNLEIGHD